MTSKTSESRGDKRRGEILKTALALFNARGTAAVSTNHIAAELGISVGNLYWHFADKDAIVRALFVEHAEKFDAMWNPARSSSDAAEVLVGALRRTFTISWERRFFYRELPALTRTDPELRKLYLAQQELRHAEIRAFLNSFVELGLLDVPGGDAGLARLEDMSWMISAFWLPHVELRDGSLTKQGALTGARAIVELVLPYASKEFARALTLALKHADDEAGGVR
ncbi:MAG TPA: TetR/AcrR family transcriptional regulator [Kofleriaceae bacterium]|nr:TetR/AcrR family transcriptional regulator [Kofleriaceae bacterium]